MGNSRFTVEHVCLTTDKPFDDVASTLVRQMGRFDPEVMRLAMTGRDPEQALAKISSMAGESGFVLFGTSDQGMLLGITGRPGKAVQFVIDSPSITLELTQQDIRAALYAPLRVLLYLDQEGQTCLEYDKPSSLFAQFDDDDITAAATLLDQKLEALANNAMAVIDVR
jgi:uncharacterized protein (DUF302 family)